MLSSCLSNALIRVPCGGGIEKSTSTQNLITDNTHENKSYSSIQAYYTSFSQLALKCFTDFRTEAETPNKLFVEYVVREDDTLIGIATDHNISLEILKADNILNADSITVGQVLKIRLRGKPGSSEAWKSDEGSDGGSQGKEREGQEDQNIRLEKRSRRNRPEETDLEESEAKKQKGSDIQMVSTCIELPLDLSKINIYYCTTLGDTEGVLMLHPGGLEFQTSKGVVSSGEITTRASISSEDSSDSDDRPKKLETWISYSDIEGCKIITLPSLHYDKDKDQDYILQLTLYNHGDKYMGKYLNSVFQGLQEKKIPYACVYFKLRLNSATNSYKEKLILKFRELLLVKAKNASEDLELEATHTKLPYFEFLYRNFGRTEAAFLEKIMKKLITKSLQELRKSQRQRTTSIGSLDMDADPSETLLNASTLFPKVHNKLSVLPSSSMGLEGFYLGEVIRHVPKLYEGLEWRLLYSNVANGSSYLSLLRKLEHKSPLIVMIRDANDFVFGAYTSNEVRITSEYYGNGETFLFTFRDLDEISVFEWTGKNSMFLFANSDGLMFGAQPYYGLWVSSDLTRGRTFECETFGNQLLALNKDFSILKIEVWTIVDPFGTEGR